MKKDIKLVAIDLDGTMLDDKKEISKKNIEILKRLKNDKIIVAISTGRPLAGFSWLRNKSGLIDENDYSIANTGTIIISNQAQKIIKSFDLDIKDFNYIKEFVKEFDLSIGFYNNDYLYNNDVEIPEIYKLEASILRMQVKGFDEENFKEKIGRLSIVGSVEELDKFQNKYGKMLEKDYTITRSEKRMLEFSNKNASKGRALSYLANYLKIDLENVLAIGDAENDRSMLEMAGLSATTKNAKKEIKEIVDIVSEKSNNESGVYDIINNYLYK